MPKPYHIRYIYPKVSRCPDCAGREWKSCGRHGSIEARRCPCGRVYKIRALSEETYTEGLPTSTHQPISLCKHF